MKKKKWKALTLRIDLDKITIKLWFGLGIVHEIEISILFALEKHFILHLDYCGPYPIYKIFNNNQQHELDVKTFYKKHLFYNFRFNLLHRNKRCYKRNKKTYNNIVNSAFNLCIILLLLLLLSNTTNYNFFVWW